MVVSSEVPNFPNHGISSLERWPCGLDSLGIFRARADLHEDSALRPTALGEHLGVACRRFPERTSALAERALHDAGRRVDVDGRRARLGGRARSDLDTPQTGLEARGQLRHRRALPRLPSLRAAALSGAAVVLRARLAQYPRSARGGRTAPSRGPAPTPASGLGGRRR